MMTVAVTISASPGGNERLRQCPDCWRSISSPETAAFHLEEGEMYGRCPSCFSQGKNSVITNSQKNALAAVTPAAVPTPAAQAIKHIYLGHFFYARGEMFSAVAQYTKVIKLCPDFAVAYVNRGFAQLRQGRDAEARGDFKQAIILHPALRFQIEERIGRMRQQRAVQF